MFVIILIAFAYDLDTPLLLQRKHPFNIFKVAKKLYLFWLLIYKKKKNPTFYNQHHVLTLGQISLQFTFNPPSDWSHVNQVTTNYKRKNEGSKKCLFFSFLFFAKHLWFNDKASPSPEITRHLHFQGSIPRVFYMWSTWWWA